MGPLGQAFRVRYKDANNAPTPRLRDGGSAHKPNDRTLAFVIIFGPIILLLLVAIVVLIASVLMSAPSA